MQKNIVNKIKYSKGFAILYASLIASLVLAIGIAILNVTVKQITLSSAGRESQHAFYSADTGVECAQYLDHGGGGNSQCQGSIFSNDPNNPGICFTSQTTGVHYDYQCIGQTLKFEDPPLTLSNGVTSHFYVDSNSTENICFDVYVTKYQNGATTIDSRGYSTCDQNSANRFERAIRSSF